MSKRLIYIGTADGKNHKPLRMGGVALETPIIPGSLVLIRPDGTGIELDFNVSTDFGIPLIIADKDQNRSKSITDTWILGENMVAILPRSGELMNILTNNGVAKGDALARDDAAGLKKALTDGSEMIVAYADEVSSDFELLRVRIA